MWQSGAVYPASLISGGCKTLITVPVRLMEGYTHYRPIVNARNSAEGLSMKKDAWMYVVAVGIGIATWIIVSSLSGRREAWDSEWYFLVSVPVICVVSAALGFLETSRPWRWGVAPLAGQFSWMLLTQGPGNLLPLGVVMFGVLSVPSIMTAKIGAYLRRSRAT